MALSFVRKGDNTMYVKKKANIIYRNYGDFGYITDNRNFRYELANDTENIIGDKVVSESGAIFLSALSRIPQSIDAVVEKISKKFEDVDIQIIKNDAMEFYSALASDGFIVLGETVEECNEKEERFSYKKSKSPKQNQKCFFHKNINNSTQEFLDKYFSGEPQLTSIHIEITSQCNERCVHCYIPHEDKVSTMDANVFFDILKQCRDMKLLHVTITGGEPMLHENFIDFLKRCNDYNFSVNILSNLTLLKNDIIEEMKKNPLLCVQTSLYSMDANVHDAITRNKGSFEKTKTAILELIENDVPLQISCPIIKQNKAYYEDVVKWGREHNVNVNSDYIIIARYDHGIHNLDCRLTLDEIQKIINHNIDNNPQYLESLEKEYIKKRNMTDDDYVCSVCHSSICVSDNGNIYPCAGWQDYIIGNINETTLSDIWNTSDKIKYLRNLRRRDFSQCVQCSEKEFCTMCMVRNANEHPTGNPLEVNKFFCNIAKLNKDIYYERR